MTTTRTPEPRPRREPRYVYVPLPRCPRCASTDYHGQRTDRGGDGSRTRHAVCKTCGTRYRIVYE